MDFFALCSLKLLDEKSEAICWISSVCYFAVRSIPLLDLASRLSLYLFSEPGACHAIFTAPAPVDLGSEQTVSAAPAPAPHPCSKGSDLTN